MASWFTRLRCAALGAAAAMSACTAAATAPPSPSRSHLATPGPYPTAAAVPVAATSLSGSAPLIVQVENSPASRPQSGLDSAAIVYEYVAEGGVGRFSAMFVTPPPVRVGPVRSARLVTIVLLKLYAGVLAYSGGSHFIEGQLSASGRPHFNETAAGGDLFRIDSRSAPHNLYSDGAHLADLLNRSRAAPIGYSYFSPLAASDAGNAAAAFSVPISAQEVPRWTWSAPLHGWTRAEPDTGALVDANSGAPVVATTVVVQQVPIAISPDVIDVNGVHGVIHTITGGGRAQVFVGGREYDASWSQPAAGPPAFTLANGQPAPMAPGLVWVELVATGTPARLG